MPSDKAPGPDGFTINFYKAYWNIVKQDIWEIVEDSRRSKTILKSLNSTFIALVPKVEEANTPEKFRPIALCNVIYKIISKVMANRLKVTLPGIISQEQSGYVEGRQILDNILLAQEMIQSLHSRKEAGMLMQLDLSKAYDKVSWSYLEAILKAFGFSTQWIKWVLALIKSPRYSILVNGAPSAPFSPSRGIRQGDPISPFLFVILMEGLSRIIAKKKAEGQIKGLQPIRSFPATTHQQFVDDTMLHGTPTVKEALAYRDILHLFSKASGMEINFSKSTIFFFNTHQAIQSHLSRLLGFKIGSLPSRYLGAPLTLKPWQKAHWEKVLATLFWEDAWQQSPKLDTPLLQPLKQHIQNLGHFKVHHYWNTTSEDPEWREWIVFNPADNEGLQNSIQDLNQQILKRKIRVAAENDKLRWGPKGNEEFSLKEARSIIEREEQLDIMPWTDKVWDSLQWPKIRTFLWLLMQKKTLTWENLLKKGFQGPSRCLMCLKEEETMNHLFNSCDWASQIWLWMEEILEASD
eukprot:PITA_29243